MELLGNVRDRVVELVLVLLSVVLWTFLIAIVTTIAVIILCTVFYLGMDCAYSAECTDIATRIRDYGFG